MARSARLFAEGRRRKLARQRPDYQCEQCETASPGSGADWLDRHDLFEDNADRYRGRAEMDFGWFGDRSTS